jgi:hypothetical protein
VENYFNYFTEIEEHFQRRRGTITLMSPLDWALMEIWKDAGVPLEAVLRGIDVSFDKWERRSKHTRKINGLGYCAQEVLSAAEQMNEASTGAAKTEKENPELDANAVVGFLEGNARQLESATVPEAVQSVAAATASSLRQVAAMFQSETLPSMEDVERRLTVMEEKLIAALLAATPEATLLQVRTEADRDLTPYRSRMTAPQIEQLHRQYVQKRLLEQYRLPRLSLFYMQ